jgi:hypothetical protein
MRKPMYQENVMLRSVLCKLVTHSDCTLYPAEGLEPRKPLEAYPAEGVDGNAVGLLDDEIEFMKSFIPDYAWPGG